MDVFQQWNVHVCASLHFSALGWGTLALPPAAAGPAWSQG